MEWGKVPSNFKYSWPPLHLKCPPWIQREEKTRFWLGVWDSLANCSLNEVWYAINIFPLLLTIALCGREALSSCLLSPFPIYFHPHFPDLPWPSLPISSPLRLWSKAVSLSDSLQIDVINTFQTGASFKGVLRRQNMGQHLDVKLVPSSSYVAVAPVKSSPTTSVPAVSSPPMGSEW